MRNPITIFARDNKPNAHDLLFLVSMTADGHSRGYSDPIVTLPNKSKTGIRLKTASTFGAGNNKERKTRNGVYS